MNSCLSCFLPLFCLCFATMFGHYAYHLHQQQATVERLNHVKPEQYLHELIEDEPIGRDPYIDALHSPELKLKAQELARAYNKRIHIIDLVWQRLHELREAGKLDPNAESIVLRNLETLHNDTKRIRQNYDNIQQFAQQQEAVSFIRHRAPDHEERIRLLNEENEALLRAIAVPMSFK